MNVWKLKESLWYSNLVIYHIDCYFFLSSGAVAVAVGVVVVVVVVAVLVVSILVSVVFENQ